MSQFYDNLDTIDAAVFSGSALELAINRRLLRGMCERWLRAIAEREARRCDSCGYQHGHRIGCDQNPADIALQVPDCPHCHKPVLVTQAPTAVMLIAWDQGVATSHGPYHKSCADAIGHRPTPTVPT